MRTSERQYTPVKKVLNFDHVQNDTYERGQKMMDHETINDNTRKSPRLSSLKSQNDISAQSQEKASDYAHNIFGAESTPQPKAPNPSVNDAFGSSSARH